MQRAQLFVGRLPKETRRSDLEDIFMRYGRVTRCDVRMGLATAYAFIDFDDHRDAEDALKYENGREMRGQRMVVEWAIDDAKHGRSMSRRNGGGGGSGGGRGRGYYKSSRTRSRTRSRSRSRSASPKRGERRRRSPSRSRSRSCDVKKSARSPHSRSKSRSRSNSR